MSDAAPEPGGITTLAKTILTDVRLVLVALVAIFGSGWVALDQVEGKATAAAQRELQRFDSRLTTLEDRQQADASTTAHRFELLQGEIRDVKANVDDARTETRLLRNDLRQLFPRLKDGGATP